MSNEALDAAVTEFVAAVNDRNRVNALLKKKREAAPKPAKGDADALKKIVATYIESYENVRPDLDAIYDRIATSGATIRGLTSDLGIVNPVEALTEAAAAERAESEKMLSRLASLARAGAGKLLMLLSLIPTWVCCTIR
ncbi:hypothetical protein H7J07_00015 [Mycobacterium koreense]|nr:hypothetical protein [Mycolicibacillus koreensis]MCV7246650.1 hypothetical protein [Mycolicibacillus koreensis]